MIASAAAEHQIVAKLVDDNAVTPVALAAMRRESEIGGVPLVEVLLDHDSVSEADVAQVYADLSGTRFLDLTRRRPDPAWVMSLSENVARRKNCLLFGEVSGELVAVVSDPVDPTVRAAVQEHFARPIQFVVSPRYQILEMLDEVYGNARAQGARFTRTAPVATAVQPETGTGINVLEQLDSILDEAVDRRASDVHIEPEADRLRIRLRIDGRLIEARAYPLEAAIPMVSRVKVLSKLDITEKRKPQDGRFTHRSFDQEIDIRVAVMPSVRGERVTLRLLSHDRSRLTLESLGMGVELRQAFERLISRPYGIILLTGPTGSGKTTTLYVALQCVNTVDRHIITVEDPVEYHIPGVNQVAVDEEYGVSFSLALRSILRHDPDVVMIGEIRDEATAHLALEAALTGHLVFATLHTNTAVGAVTRLLDMGCEPYLVASALIGTMAQRLVRKICVNCKRTYQPNASECKIMGIPPERTGVEICRGAGCSRCLRTGYYDRVGVYEFVPFDRGLTDLITAKATTATLQQYAIEHGAITLRDDAMRKVREGVTTLEEALRVTTVID